MTTRARLLFDGGELAESPALLEELRRLNVDLLTRRDPGLLPGPEGGGPPDLAVLGGALGEGRVGSLTLLIREKWPRLPLVLIAPGIAETLRPTPRCLIVPPEPRRLREAVLELFPILAAGTGSDRPLVLCVDDDVRQLRALARLIGEHGYRVAAYADAGKAMEQLMELSPDVAVLDVKMPGLDGLAMTRTIVRTYRERLPVILLSALSGDADIAQGYLEGASYYLTKPCEPRRVLNILDYLVGDLDPLQRAALETRL